MNASTEKDEGQSATSRGLTAIINSIVEVREALYDATGSALLAGEKCKSDDKRIIYEKLCAANNTLWSAVEDLQGMDSVPSETAPLVAGDLAKQREIHDTYAPVSATRENDDTAEMTEAQKAAYWFDLYLEEMTKRRQLERTVSAIAPLVDRLGGMADAAYCRAVDLSKRDLCLGEEHKLKTGTFTIENLKALEEVRREFGRAAGLWEAQSVLRTSDDGAKNG